MRVSFNTYMYKPVSMGISREERIKRQKREQELSNYLNILSTSKTATVPPATLMYGINPNKKNVFETFNKIDDVTRKIGFVKTKESWDNCLLEEMEEFMVARMEHEKNPTHQNFDHMEEEMGDIFYTAASIAKDSGINPEEAFRATNRKFFNRINLMERMLRMDSEGTQKSLASCRDYERRALWNAAKRKIYDAQTSLYKNNN